jgi:hypothetical protein
VLSSMQTDFMYDFLRDLGPHGSAASRVLFPFFCVLCGFHPTCVGVDANQKSNFSMRGLDFCTYSLLKIFHFFACSED